MTIKQAIDNRKRCLDYLLGLKGRASEENVEAVRMSIEALEFQEKFLNGSMGEKEAGK